VVQADGAIAGLVEDVDERDVESVHDIAESKIDICQSRLMRAGPEKGATVSRPLSTIVCAVLLTNTRAWKKLLDAISINKKSSKIHKGNSIG